MHKDEPPRGKFTAGFAKIAEGEIAAKRKKEKNGKWQDLIWLQGSFPLEWSGKMLSLYSLQRMAVNFPCR